MDATGWYPSKKKDRMSHYTRTLAWKFCTLSILINAFKPRGFKTDAKEAYSKYKIGLHLIKWEKLIGELRPKLACYSVVTCVSRVRTFCKYEQQAT
jgi:hypothetical protein